MARMTIRDIARLAGVSVTTVSRALNNAPEINSQTRERVLQVCREQGYRSNLLARSLVSSRTRVLGVILPELSGPFHASIVLHLERYAQEQDYQIMLCCGRVGGSETAALFDFLVSHRVDGILLVSASSAAPDLLRRHARGTPSVLLGDVSPTATLQRINAVSTDNYVGGAMAAGYLSPDNPQNYQISQLYYPICHDGGIKIDVNGQKKIVRIHEIHMEEDAGKLVHDEWEDVSLVDYNRSGVPLIEIVSEPDMRSADEVIAYLEKLRLIIQYLGASDCKLQEGSMRADVNLSVRPVGAEKFGTRTEMKNLNSFKAIARAIEAERTRQIELIEEGKSVVQETRRWDDNKEYSYPMRSKEDAQDYRYFPEPDLPPLQIPDEWIKQLKSSQPELRDEKMARYKEEYEIPDYDADIITGSKRMADIFEQTVALGAAPKKVSNWLMTETMRLLKEQMMDPDELDFSPKHLAMLIALVEKKTINQTIAKEVFEKIFADDIEPESYVKEHGLGMVSDTDALQKTVEEVIAANPQSVADYKAGKQKAIGFLVGQTMKVMKGKANPTAVNEILVKLLNE